MTTTPVHWHPRDPPLAVAGVLGRGVVARRLAATLVDRGTGDDVGVEVHLGRDVLVAVGAEGRLGWVDGAVWLGRDGPLLCPTVLRPIVPAGLVAAAVARRATDRGLVVATPDDAFVLARSEGRLDVNALRSFAAEAAR